MAYGDSKDLPRRTAFSIMLCHKGSNIAENPKYDGYQRGLALIVYKFFNKKTSGRGIKNIPTKELNKLIIRKFNKRKVPSSFIENI